MSLLLCVPYNMQGGGCFWCLEACYQQLKGVSKVHSGYAGGQEPNPTYQQVGVPCDTVFGSCRCSMHACMHVCG